MGYNYGGLVGNGPHGTDTGCGFDVCFGDFGIKNAVKTVLQRRVHADVYAHLQTVSLPWPVVLIMLIVSGYVHAINVLMRPWKHPFV